MRVTDTLRLPRPANTLEVIIGTTTLWLTRVEAENLITALVLQLHPDVMDPWVATALTALSRLRDEEGGTHP